MFYITICSILDVILKFLMNEELLVNLSLGKPVYNGALETPYMLSAIT